MSLPLEVKQCFKTKRIALAGDSPSPKPRWTYCEAHGSLRCVQKVMGKSTISRNWPVHLLDPSVYFQQISNYNYDIIVLSMCTWDMGTYFRGHLKYKHALTFALKRIQSQFKGRLILFLLHKIYPETQGCNKKCKEFNSHFASEQYSCKAHSLQINDSCKS